MFFNARPASLPLYEALEALLEAEFPAASVRVQKSQISFYGRHLFAMASLPRRKRDEGILLSLGLGRPLASPRRRTAPRRPPAREQPRPGCRLFRFQ